MAVQPQTPYKEYTANGSTKSFALGFDCDNQDHLIVLVDDIEPVVGAWSLIGGAVVFGTAPTNGKKITIQRNTPFRRDGDFQSYDNSFRPPGVNKGFDKIWLKLQELGVADWILSNRIDALKNYVDDQDDELRAYLLEEIRKQGVALDQLDDYYNYLMQRLAQIAVDKGWDAAFVVDASGKTQQEINNSRTIAVSEYGSTDANLKEALGENKNLLINETINVSEPYVSKKTSISGRSDKELYTTTSDKSLLVIADPSNINKLVDGVIVENMNFGSQPAVANDNVSAIQVARGKNGTIKYCNFSDTNTAIRVAYSIGGATSQDNAQVGNNIFKAKTMGIELLYSNYNRTIGNVVHNDGTKVGIHALRWAYGKGNISVGNSYRDRGTSGISLQVGTQNNISVGDYIENVGQSGIQSNTETAWDVNSYLGGFVVKNATLDGVDAEYMSNMFLQGVIDTTEQRGLRTNNTSNRNIFNLLIKNAARTAANIRGTKNLVTVLVDSNLADTPFLVDGNDNLVIVVCAETTVTNTVHVTGNGNTIVILEAGTGTVGLRVDGERNSVFGNVKGNTAVNGSYNTLSGCFNGALVIGASAVNTVANGQVFGTLTDGGVNSNLAGLQGASAKIQFTGTTNSTGLVTISHDLKRIPKDVHVQIDGNFPYHTAVTAKTSNTITVTIRDLATAGAPTLLNGTNVSLMIRISM